MRLLDSWQRRLQRLWSALKRWLLGVLPLFALDPAKRAAAAARRAPRGAALPAGSYLDYFVRSGPLPHHAVVDDLRRKAANELFDWLGLSMIPRQMWAILDKVGDPGGAVEQLIRALGCDPLGARRRDPKEIARLDSAIDVLVALDSLRRFLSPAQLNEIEYLLFAGDYEAVRAHSRLVKALSAMFIGREKAAGLRRFAVYEAFLQRVESDLEDPWSLRPEEIDKALRLSDRFVTGMERYTMLHKAISETIAAIHGLWPGATAASLDPARRERLVRRFADIDASLVNDATLSPDRIEELLRDCEVLLEESRKLLEDLEPDEAGPPPRPGLGEIDQALVFFGFAEGSSPSQEAIRLAYKRMMKKVHPDLAPPSAAPDETARREALAKRANQLNDLLRRRYSRAP